MSIAPSTGIVLGERRALVPVVVLVLTVALAAYVAGRRHDPVHHDTVSCLSAEGTISCELSDDHTIAVPKDGPWTERGVYHEDGRPACLPPTGIGLEGPVRLSWVEVDVDGTRWRQVVQVDCGR